MKITKVLFLRGPNIWASFPVLEATLDLEEDKDSSSDILPGFNDRLMAWMPSMIEHRCSPGVRGGFFDRLRRGTYPAHIIEHLTLELQCLAGVDVGFGKARETSVDGVYRVVIEYEEEELARRCLGVAVRLFLAAARDSPFDIAAECTELTELARNICLGPSTRAIVHAAKARGIPVRRLNEGSLVQLGFGAKQRKILTAATDRTGAIAEEIAQDKQLTRILLKSLGVSVPDGSPVRDADDAWDVAQDIGLPVVVKPRFGNQGRGVAVNLSTREQIVHAYHAAYEEEPDVVVESYVPGSDWRLLVVGNRVVAASRRDPPQLLGDGEHTISELVDIANTDVRRSDGHATALSKIHLDPTALAVLEEQGYTPESVPKAGGKLLIRRNANLSTGGTAEDVTDQVHPEMAAQAVAAAQALGLDIAGVDIVAHDISHPLETQGGAVVEVNARPGLRMHLEPSAGSPQPVGEAIVELLFPNGESGRIPLVSVSGVNGKTTTTRLIAHILRVGGRSVGMACTDGLFVDRRRIDTGDCSGPKSARNLLLNPFIDAAVLETARGGILREGLGFDFCDVAVVTNIGEGDHLGQSGIDTPEDLVLVKRCVIEAVAKNGHGVLNANDPLVAAMASFCPGAVIYFAIDHRLPALVAHREAGGQTVFVRDDIIILAHGNLEYELTSVVAIPLCHHGRIAFHVENVLAAAAAAWALGISIELIRGALETFPAGMESAPGRFNLLQIGGATVIVDYGHNPSALRAVIDAVRLFPNEIRTAVYSVPGDRRDIDMVQQGEMLGNDFDRVILYEDHYMRGRPDGEIIGLMRKGLAAGRRIKDVREVKGAVAAVKAALALIRPGELLLLQADEVEETISTLNEYLNAELEGLSQAT